ncbi:MAG TPA: dUTP diphosphatase [Candidatus Angelobacter sp.]|nr:dUTP diphosphatase [Candidatus Angelobacter sp.]
MLRVKLLHPSAKLPTIAHPGEDLGYDIYSAEDLTIPAKGHAAVSTKIAVECSSPSGEKMGALLRDRSSMAARRLVLTGGVIDAGYRGEIRVLMENLGDADATIHAGDKIANMVPYPVLTGEIHAVDELTDSERKATGFGSSGR